MKQILKQVLNTVSFLTLVTMPLYLVLMIWDVNYNVVEKLFFTDAILLISSVIIYAVIFRDEL